MNLRFWQKDTKPPEQKGASIAGVEQYTDGTVFYPLNFDYTKFGTGTIEDQRLAYQMCAPVTSIIGKLVSGHLSRKWYIQNSEGKEPGTTPANKLRKLLQQPNPFQDGKKFEANAVTFAKLFGECFIYTPMSIPGDLSSVKVMWVIPNWLIKPVYTGKIYFQYERAGVLTGYVLKVGSEEYVLQANEIIRIQDSFINTDKAPTSILNGQSRLAALNDQVTLIIKSYESNTEMVVNHGALGVISPKSAGTGAMVNLPIEPATKKELQEDFKQYGITRGKWKYILANIAMDFSSISSPLKDLQLIDGIKESVRQIAECYGVPMELLGYPEGTTFTNLQQAEKAMYEREIVPFAETYTEAFENHFLLNNNGLYYNMYYDHLEIFQKSKKETAEAFSIQYTPAKSLYDNGVITLNQMLIMLDMDTRPDGDKYVYEINKIPPAVKLGVGGTQALQMILTDATLTPDQKINIMVVIFGLTEQEAQAVMNG